MSVIKRTANPFREVGLPDAGLLQIKQTAIEYLREKMHETGMSQTEMAAKSGLEASHVSEMLSGRLDRFGVERINRALAIFDMAIEIRYALITI